MVQIQSPVQVGSLYEINITGLSHEGDGVGRYEGYTVFVVGALSNERVIARVTSIQKRFARATLEKILDPSKDRIQPVCEVYGQCGGCQLQHLSYAGQLAFKEQQVKDALQRIGHLNLDHVKVHPIIGMQDPWRYRNKAQVPVSFVEPISQEIEMRNNLSGQMKAGEDGIQLANVRMEFVNSSPVESNLKENRQKELDKHAEFGNLSEHRKHGNFGMNEEGGLIAGFYATGTHDVIDIPNCEIQHAANEDIILTVREILRELSIPSYNHRENTGIVRHMIAKVAYSTGQTMLVLVATTLDLPQKDAFIKKVRDKLPHVVSIMLNCQAQQTSKVMGEQTICLWGKEEIYDQIGPIKFSISAHSFYQVNPIQTQVLYGKALEYAALTGNEVVIDAYCGVGTISLFLAQAAKKVYGIEIVRQAIDDAKRNAKLNNMENTKFIAGKAEIEIPKLYQKGIAADVIVVDPPRKGCDQELLATITKMRPARVVYVSCNPSTLARDLKYLEEHGYRTAEVQPVDMFPHTAHVECVALLTLI